jgi:hypothetical protein
MQRRAAAVVSLLAVCLAVAPAIASASALVAQARLSPVAIDFSPAIDAERFVLNVATPRGDVLRREFGAGQAITFSIADSRSQFPDGDYRWELTAAPRLRPAERAALEAARATGDANALADAQRGAGIPEGGYVQSGSFRVADGAIVDQTATEGGIRAKAAPVTHAQAADQVIPDDLIVQGSECVGLDCLNNESFGFDTIRLKENNTRIKFEDTSTSAGFPTNDWQLTANDSASGGSSKFSIEDITGSKVPFTITAGAATNSIFADSTGRIGLRTSTPVLDLHINTSNTPAIRLEQNNSGGFTAQTWDIGANEANFFVRDVTGGSRLPLRIRPGAPTSSVDISADGNVGVGTASPEAKLHVSGTNTTDTFVGIGADPDGSTGNTSALNIGYSGSSFGRASGFFNVRPDSGAAAPNPSLRFATGNTVRLIIDNEGFLGIGSTINPAFPIEQQGTGARLTAGGIWQDGSSRAIKRDIQDLAAEEAIRAFDALQPVRFHYKSDPSDEFLGFIAEDVPALVATVDRKTLGPMDFVALLTKVVQEQQKTIDALRSRVESLEKQRSGTVE